MAKAPSENKRSQTTTQTVDSSKRIRERVATVVVGQDVVVERTLISLFTGGHLLLQEVPGLAKTIRERGKHVDWMTTTKILVSELSTQRNQGNAPSKTLRSLKLWMSDRLTGGN